MNSPDALSDAILKRDRRALSRAMSWVEDEHPGVDDIFRRLHVHTGRAVRIGITGPPGAGKSTLVARLAQYLRGRSQRVGIVAVDPTSPFTGGALLGDRIRMPDLADDDGVFMRSMATRGSLGGLAAATHEVLDLLDVFGVDWILVETVGVGQSELDVARMTDQTLVVLVPESGDAVQAMKAGLMEIGDIFVVNKADRDGADRAVTELRSMLALRQRSSGRPLIVRQTVAVDGTGVADLAAAMEKWLEEGKAGGEFAKRRRDVERWRLLHLAQRKLVRSLTIGPGGESALDRLTTDVLEHRLAPHVAAAELVEQAMRDVAGRT